MDEGFVNILLKLMTEQGKEALLNPARRKGLLSDYYNAEYEDERGLLLLALDAGLGTTIDAAPDRYFDLLKKNKARMLRNIYLMDEKRAMDVVDTLGFVLRGDTSKTENLTVKEDALPFLTHAERALGAIGKDPNLIAAQKVKLSTETLDQLSKSIDSIIYAEVLYGGVVELGDIAFYCLAGETFTRYEVNIFEDGILGDRAAGILKGNQINHNTGQGFFKLYWVGTGLFVYIHKDADLEIAGGYFIYRKGNRKYAIYSLVDGVYEGVVSYMKEERPTTEDARLIFEDEIDTKERWMDENFITLLRELVTEQGKEVLLDPTRAKPLLLDLTRNEYQNERRLLLKALEAGAGRAVSGAEDRNVDRIKDAQVRKLREEEFIEEKKAREVVDVLDLVLRGDGGQ